MKSLLQPIFGPISGVQAARAPASQRSPQEECGRQEQRDRQQAPIFLSEKVPAFIYAKI
jgi:hypothetical protein